MFSLTLTKAISLFVYDYNCVYHTHIHCLEDKEEYMMARGVGARRIRLFAQVRPIASTHSRSLTGSHPITFQLKDTSSY